MRPPLPHQRAEKPFTLKSTLNLCVYYEDTDFSGSVYHAQYLKFFERAREELLSQDALVKMLREFNCQFVVRDLKISYLKAAFFAEKLHIESEVSVGLSPSLKFLQKIYRINEGSPEKELITEAEILVVVLKDAKPRRLSPEMRTLLMSRA